MPAFLGHHIKNFDLKYCKDNGHAYLISTGRKVASPLPWLSKEWTGRPDTDHQGIRNRLKGSFETKMKGC